MVNSLKKWNQEKSNSEFNISELYKRGFEDREKIIQIDNDVAVILSLDGLYFGTHTQKYIDTLIEKYDPVLKADTGSKRHLLEIMNSEISYGLPEWFSLDIHQIL